MGLPARFWAKTSIEDHGHETSCLIWTGCKTAKGYGKFNVGGKTQYSHRLAYEALKGPLVDVLQVDHLCRQTSCCNADHLEQVSRRVNLLRGDTITAECAAKTHCPQGHPYSVENTYYRNGSRVCRTCSLKKNKEYRERRFVA